MESLVNADNRQLRYGLLFVIPAGDRLRHPDPLETRTAILRLTNSIHRPMRIVIVDGNPEPVLSWDEPLDSFEVPFRYWWTGDDLGVPGLIDVGLRNFHDCSVVLLADDPVTLNPGRASELLMSLEEGVAGVSGQRRRSRFHGPRTFDSFSWFPSALSMEAVGRADSPDSALFRWYDDLEYGVRLRRLGFEIGSIAIEAVPTSQVTPCDRYLRIRNLTYLLSRHRIPGSWFSQLVAEAFRTPQGLTFSEICRGLLDGLRGRLGPCRDPHTR